MRPDRRDLPGLLIGRHAPELGAQEHEGHGRAVEIQHLARLAREGLGEEEDGRIGCQEKIEAFLGIEGSVGYCPGYRY